MKILVFNDLHLASAAPESRIDEDFPEELFELLDQIARLALHLQVRAIAIAGDIFHVRSRCGNEMLARLGAWCLRLRSAGIRVVAIPGNHDLKHDRYETLGQQVLGLFFGYRFYFSNFHKCKIELDGRWIEPILSSYLDSWFLPALIHFVFHSTLSFY